MRTESEIKIKLNKISRDKIVNKNHATVLHGQPSACHFLVQFRQINPKF
jgi:hypothetical protein